MYYQVEKPEDKNSKIVLLQHLDSLRLLLDFRAVVLQVPNETIAVQILKTSHKKRYSTSFNPYFAGTC